MDKTKPNILCIALTPALDHYVTADGFALGKINRAIDVMERAGGKSINGARAIQKVGGNPLVISALGGHRGTVIMNYAQEEGIDLLAVRTEDETRQYTEIWDGISKVSTHISERWSQILPSEWQAYIELIQEQIGSQAFGAAVISGSMPPGVELKEVTRLVKMILDAGIACFVDSEGAALRSLLAARPTVVKINHFEAGHYLGVKIETLADAVSACKQIVAQGIKSCVITMGDLGAIGATSSAVYHVTIDNKGLWPVGSGDSFLGAMAVKWAQGESWLNTLIAGTAAGTANAHQRISGNLDMDIYELGLKTVKYTQLE